VRRFTQGRLGEVVRVLEERQSSFLIEGRLKTDRIAKTKVKTATSQKSSAQLHPSLSLSDEIVYRTKKNILEPLKSTTTIRVEKQNSKNHQRAAELYKKSHSRPQIYLAKRAHVVKTSYRAPLLQISCIMFNWAWRCLMFYRLYDFKPSACYGRKTVHFSVVISS
jgi:hypothetical protein